MLCAIVGHAIIPRQDGLAPHYRLASRA